MKRESALAFPFLYPKSTLHAEHLLELVQCLRQIRLISHHFVNRLIGAWNFIEHPFVFPAHNAFRLLLKITNREMIFGLGAAHLAACAV